MRLPIPSKGPHCKYSPNVAEQRRGEHGKTCWKVLAMGPQPHVPSPSCCRVPLHPCFLLGIARVGRKCCCGVMSIRCVSGAGSGGMSSTAVFPITFSLASVLQLQGWSRCKGWG